MRRTLIALAPLALTGGLTIAACGPPPQTGAVLCAKNPATGHVFATIDGALNCGPGPVIVVDVPCGPLTITTAEDDRCVRAHIVGDGTSTGVRGNVIVPLSYVNPAAGDTWTGVVE